MTLKDEVERQLALDYVTRTLGDPPPDALPEAVEAFRYACVHFYLMGRRSMAADLLQHLNERSTGG